MPEKHLDLLKLAADRASSCGADRGVQRTETPASAAYGGSRLDAVNSAASNPVSEQFCYNFRRTRPE